MLEEWMQNRGHTEDFNDWMDAGVNEMHCPSVIGRMHRWNYPEKYQGGLK